MKHRKQKNDAWTRWRDTAEFRSVQIYLARRTLLVSAFHVGVLAALAVAVGALAYALILGR